MGRDATIIFETYHNIENVLRVLNKLPLIGDLIDSDLPVFRAPSEFHMTIREQTHTRLANAKIDSKHSYKAWLTYGVIMMALLLSYYQQFFGIASKSTALQLIFASLHGFACAQLCLHTIHDASHFSITHNPLVWKILGAGHDFINGASFLVWNYQHVLGHHPYTNIHKADPDIYVDPAIDFRRIMDFQPWFKFYKFQYIYAPMLYAALAVKTRIQDVTILYIRKSNGPIAINPPTTIQNATFWGGKAFFLTYRILIPLLMGFSYGKVAVLFLASDIVVSYWLALTFQANHVVDDVELPVEKVEETDWAKMQISATLDYGIDSVATRLVTGALNFQTVHHLFPNVLQHHYPLIYDIVRDECAKNDVKYNTKGTLLQALNAHIQHLKNLGEKEA